jgi:hypothetical protein
MTRMRASIASVLAVTALVVLSILAVPAGASAKGLTMATVKNSLADKLMQKVTARMTHDGPNGFNQDSWTIDQLMHRYDSGKRLFIQCGAQARVARVVLARHGIHSRLIGVISAEGPFDGSGDGHTFMEVRISHHWVAYDPDGNREPVDAKGQPIGAVKEAATRPFHWRFIAHDPFSMAYPGYTYKQLDQAVAHVMGIVVILVGDPEHAYYAYYQGTPENVARVKSYPTDLGYIPASDELWAELTKDEA